MKLVAQEGCCTQGNSNYALGGILFRVGREAAAIYDKKISQVV